MAVGDLRPVRPSPLLDVEKAETGAILDERSATASTAVSEFRPGRPMLTSSDRDAAIFAAEVAEDGGGAEW